MDFLDFTDVSFLPNSSIGQLCGNLNTIVEQGIWYDILQVKNKKHLWLLNDIVTIINSNNVLGASFRLYPSYVPAILNSVKEINFSVLCDKHINYEKYFDKILQEKSALLNWLQKTILRWLEKSVFSYHLVMTQLKYPLGQD